MILRMLLVVTSCTLAGTALADGFKFVALGDMPYFKRNATEAEKERITEAYEALIAAINARAPAFTLHVGDTKSGKAPCSEPQLEEQLKLMNTFASALIYTPGDNEWTDCQPDDGSGDTEINRKGGPRGWLRRIRELYYPSNESLGGAPITLERQGDPKGDLETSYVENARFEQDGVVIATVHVVGSNNGFNEDDAEAETEYRKRDAADRAWLKETFALAEKKHAKAVVIAMHGDIFRLDYDEDKNEDTGSYEVAFSSDSGHKNIAEELARLARAFKKPVLLVYGDSHRLKVSRPFPKAAPNVLAVEVYGERDINAVEITVEPESGGTFSVGSVLPNAPR